MKGSKTSLFLVELVLALLLFTFCAAVCIQIFHAAHNTTAGASALSKSVFTASNAAEAYKATGGDLRAVGDALTGGSGAATVEGSAAVVLYDAHWLPTREDARFSLTVREFEDRGAEITVYDVQAPEKALYSLTVKAVTP